MINTHNEDCESDSAHVESTTPVRKKQTILAHVIIELKDKPWELFKALKIFKVIIKIMLLCTICIYISIVHCTFMMIVH